MNDGLNGKVLADPLAAMLGYQLRRASVAVMASLSQALTSLELRPSEASLLAILKENPGCTQSDVSRALGVQPANMVPIINKLVTAGLIVRTPGGGRAIAMFLTDRGIALADAAGETFARHEARIARSLKAEEQRQLLELLGVVCKDACCDDGR